MSLKSSIQSILNRKVVIKRLGSVPVAKDANPHGVVDALRDRELAHGLAAEAKVFFMTGRTEAAVTRMCESIVLEDSVGNIWGIVSDLGNIAEFYRHAKEFEKAENILVWLRTCVNELLERSASVNPNNNHPSEYELRDYRLLYAQHTHGLALVYLQTNRSSLAVELLPTVLAGYREAGREDLLNAGMALERWLKQ